MSSIIYHGNAIRQDLDVEGDLWFVNFTNDKKDDGANNFTEWLG